MERWHELAAAVALVATVAVAVVARDGGDGAGPGDTAVTDGNSFVVRDARVFDGERVIERATVLVRDGRIAEVGADVVVPDGLQVVDGAGRTLLPGLVDAHVHAWGDARSDALRFGVTAELDMLGDWHRLPTLRAQRESLDRTREADLWSAGAAVTAPGGHGTQYGIDVPTLAAGDAADAYVGARVQEGSDYIKVIVEDLAAYSATRRVPTLAPAQVAAAIEAAHARDRLAVAHVSRHDDALFAVRAGADGLVHQFIDAPVDDAFVQAIVDSGAFVVPTLSVLMGVAGTDDASGLARDPRLQPRLAPAQVASLQTRLPLGAPDPALPARLLAGVGALHAAGVPVLAGTDAGNPGTTHGASLHGELELLVRAGLSPVEALAAATSVPAEAFGLEGRGRIAPGARADLVLVDGDPTTDITATRAIAAVWKNGYAVPLEPARAGEAAPAPAGTLVDDFDGDALQPRFGTWQGTTDAMAGGASTAEHALVPGGADRSRGALAVRGEVRPGFPYPWAGVMFFPGDGSMAAYDYSGRTELVFHVRGDGRQYNALLFSGPSAQAIPAIQPFTAGSEWTEVRLRLDAFPGGDPAQLRAIAFTAGQPTGRFAFFLDRVELR